MHAHIHVLTPLGIDYMHNHPWCPIHRSSLLPPHQHTRGNRFSTQLYIYLHVHNAYVCMYVCIVHIYIHNDYIYIYVCVYILYYIATLNAGLTERQLSYVYTISLERVSRLDLCTVANSYMYIVYLLTYTRIAIKSMLNTQHCVYIAFNNHNLFCIPLS